MKNIIAFNYNLFVKNFIKRDNIYFLEINALEYVFCPFYGEKEQLEYIYSFLQLNRVYCHEIIINVKNSLFTVFEGITYVLLKKSREIKDKINFNTVISYNLSCSFKKKLNWKNLWISKNDYYEYQINQLGIKYPFIRKQFSYFLGLSETAISLLNFVDETNVDVYISHKRIYKNEDINTFINPLEFTLDCKVRDFAEFFKIGYINEEFSIDQIVLYLKQYNFSKLDRILFFARLLYPTFFYDLYDQIIQEKVDEKKIQILAQKNEYYELFLKKIYNFFRFEYDFPEIEWLEFK